MQDEVLDAVIMEAQRLNLRVFLMPYIYLKSRANGRWRGVLEPEDRDLWWQEYEDFIMHYVHLVKKHEIALFSVGSELLSMESDRGNWEVLIKKIREALPKTKLIYSANWDRFESFGMWKNLDYIGVSTYPPLSTLPSPDYKDLNAGWGSFRQRLAQLRFRFPNKKIIFTEVGYPSRIGAAKDPWVYNTKSDTTMKHVDAERVADPELQALLYRVLFERWFNETFMEGMYIWNWFGEGGEDDTGYSPRGKKAEEVLKDWYL